MVTKVLQLIGDDPDAFIHVLELDGCYASTYFIPLGKCNITDFHALLRFRILPVVFDWQEDEYFFKRAENALRDNVANQTLVYIPDSWDNVMDCILNIE